MACVYISHVGWFAWHCSAAKVEITHETGIKEGFQFSGLIAGCSDPNTAHIDRYGPLVEARCLPPDRRHGVRDELVHFPADKERVHEPGRQGEQEQPSERGAGERGGRGEVQPARVPAIPRHAAAGGLPGDQPLLRRPGNGGEDRSSRLTV
uniref:Uncharacterized protein n=1 Tax=Leersia perrieri TaxID=77586 RepID=A0A0D9X197_9ORYZ